MEIHKFTPYQVKDFSLMVIARGFVIFGMCFFLSMTFILKPGLKFDTYTNNQLKNLSLYSNCKELCEYCFTVKYFIYSLFLTLFEHLRVRNSPDGKCKKLWYYRFSLNICHSTYQKVTVFERLNFELRGCNFKISRNMVWSFKISHILESSILKWL